jgi:dephospho-CoA kinase
MKVIGLTGGIGAGKSTVAMLCKENFKVAVIETDQVAKDQMMPGGCSYEGVVQEFGRSILKEDGEIDRAALAKIVFADPDHVKKINAITHPNVKTYTLQEIKRLSETNGYEAVLVETALLFEAKFDEFCDETWCVYASLETRKRRLYETRGYSMEKIDAILSNQDKDQFAITHCTHVIENEDSTSREQLIPQLREILDLVKL